MSTALYEWASSIVSNHGQHNASAFSTRTFLRVFFYAFHRSNERTCGPECALCSVTPLNNRYTHPVAIANWDTIISSTWAISRYPHGQQIIDTQCICWPCKKMLIRKAENSTGKENVVDATPIRHKTCAVVDCKGNAICHYPSGCQVQLAFEDATSPGDMVICKAHYNTCTTKKRHCGQCLTLLVPTEPSRKSPNIMSVASKLRQDGIKVDESDVFCTACYKAQLEMIRVDGQASTDYKLKKTIEQHLGQSDSLAQVIVMTATLCWTAVLCFWSQYIIITFNSLVTRSCWISLFQHWASIVKWCSQRPRREAYCCWEKAVTHSRLFMMPWQCSAWQSRLLRWKMDCRNLHNSKQNAKKMLYQPCVKLSMAWLKSKQLHSSPGSITTWLSCLICEWRRQ